MLYIIITALAALSLWLWVCYNQQKAVNKEIEEAYTNDKKQLKTAIQYKQSLVDSLKYNQDNSLKAAEELQSKLDRYKKAEDLGITYPELLEQEAKGRLVKALHEKTKAAAEKQKQELLEGRRERERSRSSKKSSSAGYRSRGNSRSSSSSSSGYYDDYSSLTSSSSSSSSSGSSSSSDSYSGGGGDFGGGGSGGDW